LIKSKERESFGELIAQIKAGDDWAMAELLNRYAEPMRRTADQLIGRLLQAQLDSVDLVQSVQLILWLGLRSGKFSVQGPSGLLALAKLLLQRKVARYWRTAKFAQVSNTIDGDLAATLADRQVYENPRSCAEFDDLVEHFLARLDSLDQRLVKLRFEGYSTADAARYLQLDPKLLRVRLGRLRRRFSEFRESLTGRPEIISPATDD
jgi:RNA polymerase sigma-70 factor (ECF subfamily)